MSNHRSSRTSSICAGTLALVAFVGACNDGSGGLTNGAAGSSSTGNASTTGGTSTSAAGTGVLPVAGTGSATGGSAGTSTDTGGTPAMTGGTTAGGTSGATTGGATTAGAAGMGGSTMTGGLKQGPFKMLVLSTTLEFHHDSIPTCLTMLNDLGMAAAPERATVSGLAADATWTVDQINPDPDLKTDPNYFSEVTADNLAKYEMMYSDNPTGPVFTNAPDGANKKTIFQNWFGNGGAWAGQHSGTDFENNSRWPWWDDNVAGGWFVDHNGETTPGTIAWQPGFADHPILKGLTTPWNTQDEWYIMNRDIEAVPGFKVLAKVTTVGTMNYPNATQRPAVWITENAKGGRAFYTIRGHAQKVYAEPEFRQLMLRGILWAVHRLPGGN